MTLGPSFSFVGHGHWEMLLKFARRLVPTEADAQDLVQQTLMSCLEYSVSKPPPEHLDHWLMRVLRNNVTSGHRKADVRKRAENDPNIIPSSSTPDPAEGPSSIYEEVTTEHLEAAVEQLSPKLQEAYRPHMEGRSNDEIARELNISPNAVAKRLFDARRRLRELLTPGTEGDES